jgi:bifunctional UDP-N-acetylglucosamine pyrophosphorylase / glucosamine-1-phosphate N-acetyltransferase
MSLGCLILAAGEGKRMKSRLAKPLHRVCGRTLIAHVLEYVRALGPDPIGVVLGVGREAMTEALAGERVRLVIQEQQLGTGHAVMAAAATFANLTGDLLVTSADIPLIRPETLRALLAEHRDRGAAATVLTALYDDPTGYGRVRRDGQGLVAAIVEDRDAAVEVRTLREINAGVYCFNAPKLYEALGRLQPDNTQGEYYLTDVIGDLVARGESVAALCAADPEEVIGINNRVQLAQAETTARTRLREQLMLAGVTMVDPASTYVDAGVTIGQDTVLWPGTVISGETVIGEGCTIGPHVQIESCTIGDGCLIRQGCVLSQSRFGRGVQVGPYSHVRPGCQVDGEARVGSYSELVRTHLGRKARDQHFSYLGDAEVGAGVNIGAGTITCNYDGKRKHRTVIGDEAFIGSGTVLVAPVAIGDGAYTAAGSIITKDVPPESLAIARTKQETHAGWVRQRKEKERRS